jgi:enoyl-CoA hydratase/carnithine racemase
MLDIKDSVATITLNRPDVMNVFNEVMIAETQNTLDELEHNIDVRVVIVTGTGRAFCTGADLNSVDKFISSSTIMSGEFDRFSQSLNTLFTAFENLSKPTISAVNGYALAGGLELVLACDLVVCSDKAKLGDQHTNVGLIGASGGTQRLPRIIGIRKAKELLLTGDMISAEEAERLGLVNKVVPADQLIEAANELATKIANKSPLVSQGVKMLVNQGMQTDLQTGIQLERGAVVRHHYTKDIKEGIQAFKEKRTPDFKGQ